MGRFSFFSTSLLHTRFSLLPPLITIFTLPHIPCDLIRPPSEPLFSSRPRILRSPPAAPRRTIEVVRLMKGYDDLTDGRLLHPPLMSP